MRWQHLAHARLSTHISDQIYDGRYFDPSTRAALAAVWQLVEPATGTVKLGLHKAPDLEISQTKSLSQCFQGFCHYSR